MEACVTSKAFMTLISVVLKAGVGAKVGRRSNDLLRDFSGSRNVRVAGGQKKCLGQGI